MPWWYSGHILTGLSIVFTHTNYTVACACVFIGQAITIFSRPIGRMADIKVNKKMNSVVVPENEDSI